MHAHHNDHDLKRPPRRGELTVVGFGIAVGRHMTAEAERAIRAADRVFYVLNGLPAELYLKMLNPRAESLSDCYAAGLSRAVSYRRMADRMVAAVKRGAKVCAVFYGHPGVLAEAPHRAVARVRRLGLPALMQPGIAADACLFADLGINPGDAGCQSFEATSFLYRRIAPNPQSNLILWQVGVIGVATGGADLKSDRSRVAYLVRHLRRYYPASQRVVIYSASAHPLAPRVIRRTTLARLPRHRLTSASTLFIPAAAPRHRDLTIERWLLSGGDGTRVRSRVSRASA